MQSVLRKCESLLLSIIYKDEQRAVPFPRAMTSPQSITSIPYETQANWVATVGRHPHPTASLPFPIGLQALCGALEEILALGPEA